MFKVFGIQVVTVFFQFQCVRYSDGYCIFSGLMAESERMRHRLEILQMKISNLNLARMNGMPPPQYPGKRKYKYCSTCSIQSY